MTYKHNLDLCYENSFVLGDSYRHHHIWRFGSSNQSKLLRVSEGLKFPSRKDPNPWTAEENNLLKEAVKLHGTKWAMVAEFVKVRDYSK
jgi:hypothetical protein